MKERFRSSILIIKLFFLLIIIASFFLYPFNPKVWFRPKVIKASSAGPITGTFVQPDTTFNTEAYYNSFFENLKEAGMDTAIFTSVANLNNSCPLGDIENIEEISWFDVQKPEIPGLKPMLNVAKKKNIKLFFGGVSITNPTCFSFLAGEAGKETTTKGRYIAATIRAYNKLKTYVESQGWDWNDPNFIQGFYLGYEVDITDYLNNPDPNVLSYFIDMSSQLKNAFPNKLLLHSPYKHKGTSYNTAFSSINNFLYKTSVDIIAPQDGVGADLVISYQENSDHFRALKDAVTSYNASHPGKNRQAWANVETFMLNSTKDDFIPSDITRVSQQIASSQPYVSRQITWIFQHTMTTIPELYSTASWTKQYTPINAIRRQNLRNGYMALYAPQEKPFIKHIFPWNADMAIKGELGVTGQTAAITVLYLDSQKNFYQKNFTPIIKMEDMQVVYIPLASLAGIDQTLPYSAYVNESTSVTPTPTSPPTPTPTLTQTPTPTKTPTPTQPPGTKTGDLNTDNEVDIFDYNILVSNFGKTGSSGFIPADIVKNGKVDIFDYNQLIANFGK